MAPTTTKTGGCLCGAVRFEAQLKRPAFSACHCDMCRRLSSGPYMAVNCGTDVAWTGAENIGRFKSSDWAERGFCKVCGSNLFYHAFSDDHYSLSVGTFDDPSDLTMKIQFFIDEKPDGYTFANDTKTMTGAEIFALYPSKDGE